MCHIELEYAYVIQDLTPEFSNQFQKSQTWIIEINHRNNESQYKVS